MKGCPGPRARLQVGSIRGGCRMTAGSVHTRIVLLRLGSFDGLGAFLFALAHHRFLTLTLALALGPWVVGAGRTEDGGHAHRV